MRISIITTIFAALVPALADDLKVPGQSPVEFCDGDRTKNLLTISKVDLTPNPPQAGKPLHIVGSGKVSQVIQQGAYAKVVVNAKVGVNCPIQAGDVNLDTTFDMPSVIPPGIYNVSSDVFDINDGRITCLKASVKFGTAGLGSDL